MKKLLLFLFLLPVCVWADGRDSTTAKIAVSILEQMNMDTTGTDLIPSSLATKYARIGVDKVGWDLGIDTSAKVILSSGRLGVKVDTGLIRVSGVFYDSAGYTRRGLIQVSPEAILSAQFFATVTANKNATHFYVMGDSIFLGPVSGGTDTFTVLYYKKAKQLSLDTAMTNLPNEYRDLATLWGCYKASQRIGNGRSIEFLKDYKEQVADIWISRGIKTSSEE